MSSKSFSDAFLTGKTPLAKAPFAFCEIAVGFCDNPFRRGHFLIFQQPVNETAWDVNNCGVIYYLIRFFAHNGRRAII